MVAHVGRCSNIRAFMPSRASVPQPEEASGTSDQEECAEKSQKATRKQTDLNSNTLLGNSLILLQGLMNFVTCYNLVFQNSEAMI